MKRVYGESASARLGDLLGRRDGRRLVRVGHTGFCTLNSLSFANLGLTHHVLSVLGIIFVV